MQGGERDNSADRGGMPSAMGAAHDSGVRCSYAAAPKPDVFIEGDLMYGLVPLESKASKTFKITNRGNGPAQWRLDMDK